MKILTYFTRWNENVGNLIFWIILIQFNIVLGYKFWTGVCLGAVTSIWIYDKFYYTRKKNKINIMLDATGMGEIFNEKED